MCHLREVVIVARDASRCCWQKRRPQMHVRIKRERMECRSSCRLGITHKRRHRTPRHVYALDAAFSRRILPRPRRIRSRDSPFHRNRCDHAILLTTLPPIIVGLDTSSDDPHCPRLRPCIVLFNKAVRASVPASTSVSTSFFQSRAREGLSSEGSHNVRSPHKSSVPSVLVYGKLSFVFEGDPWQGTSCVSLVVAKESRRSSQRHKYVP